MRIATVSAMTDAGELERARSLMDGIHRSLSWNPWVLKDRAAEYKAACALVDQHAKSQLDYVEISREEIEAEVSRRMAELDARIEADFAQQERRRAEREREQAERAPLYDRRREMAQLVLLEQQGRRISAIRERDEILESGPVSDNPRDTGRVWLAKAKKGIADGAWVSRRAAGPTHRPVASQCRCRSTWSILPPMVAGPARTVHWYMAADTQVNFQELPRVPFRRQNGREPHDEGRQHEPGGEQCPR